MSKTMKPSCVTCGDTFSKARKSIGYKLCMPCGDGEAKQRKHTIVPSHKSNYMVVTNLADLKDLNPKHIRSAA